MAECQAGAPLNTADGMAPAMMAMVRDRGYDDLLPMLRGRRVLLWTCDTCARLCGVGGREAAEALASRLSSDGVEVTGVASSGACCLMGRSRAMAEGRRGHDLVLALCCDVGARNAGAATGSEVLNPVVTLGPGLLDEDGSPRVCVYRDGRIAGDEPLGDAARRLGLGGGPIRRPSHAL